MQGHIIEITNIINPFNFLLSIVKSSIEWARAKIPPLLQEEQPPGNHKQRSKGKPSLGTAITLRVGRDGVILMHTFNHHP